MSGLVAFWCFKNAKTTPACKREKKYFQCDNYSVIEIMTFGTLSDWGGRDSYFKITEMWKTRNNVNIEGWIESTHHWKKSMVHWIESMQGWNKSIVKKNDTAWKAQTSTIEINQPAISYNTNSNNLISTNKSNIDSSKVYISKETEKEISPSFASYFPL